MRETDPNRKARLRKDIEEQHEQLREAMGDVVPDEALDWRVEFVEVIAKGGFDVILANPPYVVVKSSALRALYQDSVFGRMNTYGLFLHRSLQLLSDDGQLQFINPRTLLTDRYFTKLRDVIRSSSELRGVVLIQDRHNTFQRVLQECIIFHAARASSPSNTYMVQVRAIARPDELNNDGTVFRVESKRALLGAEHNGAFYVGPSELHYAVFEQMKRTGKTLQSLGLRAETGKVQFDKYSNFALAESRPDASSLIWAENIQRYCTRASSKRVGKEYLSKSLSELIPPSIANKGIATQRVTASEQPRRIIATVIEPRVESAGTYSENHTNFIPFDQDQQSIAEFVLAAMNSSAMDFVFRHLNSNTQVSAGELNALPFPPVPGLEILEEIRDLVRVLLESGGADAPRDFLPEAFSVEKKIDELVGTLYGLSSAQVTQITEALPSHMEVYGLTDEELAAFER